MGMVYALLPISMLLALVGVFAFRWAVSDRQFEQSSTDALRVMFDDETDHGQEPEGGSRRGAAGASDNQPGGRASDA
jgi:cbb3-type cytochrome oxidase maturation protein